MSLYNYEMHILLERNRGDQIDNENLMMEITRNYEGMFGLQ